MTPDAFNARFEGFLAEYDARLKAALEMLTGEPVTLTPIPRDDAQSLIRDALHRDMANWTWSGYALGTQPPSAIHVGASELTSKAIGAKILLAAGIEEITDSDVNDSYSEVQQSAVAALAQWLSRQLGADIACTVSGSPPKTPDAADCWLFRLKMDDQRLDPVCLAVPAALQGVLLGTSAGAPEEVQAQAPPVAGNAPQTHPAAAAVPAAAADPSIGRILDFELPLRVSFGKAHLPLRDVLKLTTGSIIELDRSISDPVEIVVNNRVIGRGEVVVVEGNYGIRIQEITTHGG
ncbi:MAG: flagellar motor switch protein FliN [Bryobacterales bacterium]|jgi:flagellar motor switch protein FliN/FliY|nr:flagellar motor switch protein FliN [Bryobacterales bacterium]